MPAAGGDRQGEGRGRQAPQHWRGTPGAAHSQMMAIMELKLPILKHSRATSMKNSSMRVRCFFFTTWRAPDNSAWTPLGVVPSSTSLMGSCLCPQSCGTRVRGAAQAAEAGDEAVVV